MPDAEAILSSLSLASERCADPAPRVYAALFARHPEMEVLFARDANGAVRGEMLAKAFETVIDLVEARAFGENMLRCEVVTHEGYGVPREVFGIFFEVVVETLKDLSGADWTPRTDRAWRHLLLEMAALTL
jgi:hemoglobin-like flavoprotein